MNQKGTLYTVKVSTSKVLVPKIEKDEREVKGADWMAAAYPNVFILAMKNSGKSVLAINLLKKKLSKDTKILIFSPTVNMDAAWIKTVEDLEDKGYQVQTYSSFIDEDKVDVLKQFMEDYDSKLDIEDDTKRIAYPDGPKKVAPVQPVFQTIPGVVWAVRNPNVVSVSPTSIAPLTPAIPVKKPKKPKYVSPAFIVVIDDMGKQMRHKSLVTLMKNNRHYKTMTIMSSQYLTDLFPEQIAQLQYVMLFSRIPEDKLEKIFEQLAISSVTYEQFSKMYYDATSVKYRFLYVGRHDEEQFRRGMTDKYILPKRED